MTPRDEQITTLKHQVQSLTARVSALEALVARGVITPTPGRLTAQQIRNATPAPNHEHLPRR